MNLSRFILILGVVLILLAAFGASIPHVSLAWLGVGLCFASAIPIGGWRAGP